MISVEACTELISIDNDNRKLLIQWPDGGQSQFHYVWLRHNARSPKGLSNDTDVKIDLIPDNPELLSIDHYELDNRFLRVHWHNDDLHTQHDLDDLHASAYDNPSRQARKHVPKLWEHANADEIPLFEFEQLSTQSGLLALLLGIRDYGLVKLHNVPTQAGSIRSVAEKIGTIHVNNYGELFDVKTDVNVDMGSNTGVYLGPHTDEGYRHYPPGISLFHCLKSSTSGGESILVDGFAAARRLQQIDNDAYQTLCTVPVLFQRLAESDEDMRTHARVITTDSDGDVTGIRFSDRTLPPQDTAEHNMEALYQAIKAFWNIVNSAELKYQYLMQAGDLHIFDNHRVLHGRTAFNPSSGSRHLQQCSVNTDEFHSRLRLLARKLNHPESDLVMATGALN